MSKIPDYIGTNLRDTPRPAGEIVMDDGSIRGAYPVRPAIHDPMRNRSYYATKEVQLERSTRLDQADQDEDAGKLDTLGYPKGT